MPPETLLSRGDSRKISKFFTSEESGRRLKTVEELKEEGAAPEKNKIGKMCFQIDSLEGIQEIKQLNNVRFFDNFVLAAFWDYASTYAVLYTFSGEYLSVGTYGKVYSANGIAASFYFWKRI